MGNRKLKPFFQRRYFRVPFNTPVEFNILKYGHQKLAHLSTKKGTGLGHDLGEDGLSFITNYCLPVDMIIRIIFNLPNGERRFLARVVRTQACDRRYLTAVQFINHNGIRREDLRTFIIGETRKQYKFLNYI